MSLLEVCGLVRRYGALRATDDCTLTVRAGELHALIGPNGAGKTTLIHQLSGALRPDAGTIAFDGHNVTALGMAARVRLGLARSYQISQLFAAYPVRDNLRLALLARHGRLWQTLRPVRADAALADEAAQLAAQVGLAAELDTPAGRLAHGQQRQLEIALALATRPRLLLLDEPLAGMGPDEAARMVALLHTLRGQLTLLLVEHDMDAVFQLADRISALVAGRVIASGTPEDIRAHPEVITAYLGDEWEAVA